MVLQQTWPNRSDYYLETDSIMVLCVHCMPGLLIKYTDLATGWTTTEFDLFPIPSVLNSSGPHLASYPNVSRGSRMWNWQLTSMKYQGSECVELCLCYPMCQCGMLFNQSQDYYLFIFNYYTISMVHDLQTYTKRKFRTLFAYFHLRLVHHNLTPRFQHISAYGHTLQAHFYDAGQFC